MFNTVLISKDVGYESNYTKMVADRIKVCKLLKNFLMLQGYEVRDKPKVQDSDFKDFHDYDYCKKFTFSVYINNGKYVNYSNQDIIDCIKRVRAILNSTKLKYTILVYQDFVYDTNREQLIFCVLRGNSTVSNSNQILELLGKTQIVYLSSRVKKKNSLYSCEDIPIHKHIQVNWNNVFKTLKRHRVSVNPNSNLHRFYFDGRFATIDPEKSKIWLE